MLFSHQIDRLRSAVIRLATAYRPLDLPIVFLRSALDRRDDHLHQLADHGLVVPAYIRSTFSDEAVAWQEFGKREYDFPLSHSPRTIIDAGANIGLASLWFAHRFPDARIIAIEPDRENFALLSLNTARLPNITPLRGALWNQSGFVRLLDTGSGAWALRVESIAPDSVRESPPASDWTRPLLHTSLVEAFTMEDILVRFGIDRVELLKVDIEGAEREVFDAPARWIDRVDSIVVELHDHLSPGARLAFESATQDFPLRSRQGENHYVARATGP